MNKIGSLVIVFIGICQWIYAFVLTLCVVMSNDHASPALKMSLSTQETTARTILFVVPIVLSWLGAYSFLAKRRWAWFYTLVLSAFLLATGLESYRTGGGPMALFVGNDSLGHTASLIVASLAALGLVLLVLPAVRRPFSLGK
jgi:hypothetical protein